MPNGSDGRECTWPQVREEPCKETSAGCRGPSLAGRLEAPEAAGREQHSEEAYLACTEAEPCGAPPWEILRVLGCTWCTEAFWEVG